MNTLSRLLSPMSSAGVGGESDLYLDIPATTSHKKLSGTPTTANMETFPSAAGKAHGHQQRTLDASASQIDVSNPSAQESDAKSDTSFDPLFDDEPDLDGEGDSHVAPDGGVGNKGTSSHKENDVPGGYLGLAVPDGGPFDATLQARQAARSLQSSVAPPKNAPPLLSAENSSTFSPDILMISAIDGQVMLWDKRANTPGKGVGRLWLSEKTPPWCVSVRTRNTGIDRQTGQLFTGMLVNRRIADLRRPTERDSGCLGCSAARTQWTEPHASVSEESAKSGEFWGRVVCCAVS